MLELSGIAASSALLAGCTDGGTEDDPENGSSTDDPENESSTDDPENESSTDDPENESSTDDPENESSTDDPENESSTDDPENESSTDDPENGEDDEETQDGEGGNGEAIDPGEILLDGYTAGWEGVEPEAIAGETNPTLTLQEGETYEITWENQDGAGHNLEIRDGDGEVVDDYETEVVSGTGETQTLEVEASSEMVEYLCDPHEGIMVGDIEIG